LRINLRYRNLKTEENIVELKWDSCVATGYTGRDQKAVMAHIKELEILGIPAPQKVPAMYWIDPERVGTSKTLYVIGETTSGEVEFFFAKDKNGKAYVTIASDHTDRKIEKESISKAKQICSKIIAENCWKVSDIRDHWDDIIIRVKIKEEDNSPEILYQEGSLKKILLPEELERICEQDNPRKQGNIAILSGTLPLISNQIIFAKIYRLIMSDPVLKREISHTYRVFTLPDRS
jgi:hypothetical protein